MKGLPEIPRIPLKYVASINDEALRETSDPDFELQYIDISSVDSNGNILVIAKYPFSIAPSRARRIVRDGDVIISTVRTYLQAIAAIESPPDNLIVSTGFAVVRPRPGRLSSKYCKYALRDPEFIHEVISRSVGVSYPAITSLDLAAIPIRVPSQYYQCLVADYLDNETARIDALIDAKQRLLDLLAEKRLAMLTEMVLCGINENVTLQETSVDWLGLVPENWDVMKIGYLFRERDERNQPNLPLLNVSIHTGVTLRDFSGQHVEQMAEDFSVYKVAHQGDISFNKMRMWQGAVGVAPVTGLVSPDYVVAQPVAPIDVEYYGQLFRTSAFSAEAARYSRGIVWDRLRLYWQEFKDIWVPVPPLEEQRAIVSIIEAETRKIDALALAAQNSIDLLKERRIALISAAVTGQIPIPEVSCS